MSSPHHRFYNQTLTPSSFDMSPDYYYSYKPSIFQNLNRLARRVTSRSETCALHSITRSNFYVQPELVQNQVNVPKEKEHHFDKKEIKIDERKPKKKLQILRQKSKTTLSMNESQLDSNSMNNHILSKFTDKLASTTDLLKNKLMSLSVNQLQPKLDEKTSDIDFRLDKKIPLIDLSQR